MTAGGGKDRKGAGHVDDERRPRRHVWKRAWPRCRARTQKEDRRKQVHRPFFSLPLLEFS